MENSGLNIEKIRENNKLRVMAIDVNNQRIGDDIFSAYLTSPLGGFGTGIKTPESLTKQVGEYIKSFGIIGKALEGTTIGKFKDFLQETPALNGLLGTQFEYSNILNYNYNYRFNDVEEFNHSFTCELVTKDDYITDVIEPLWRLLTYVMPDESPQLTDPNGGIKAVKNAEGAVVKAYDKFKEWAQDKFKNVIEEDALNKLWGFVEGMGAEIKDMYGGLSILTKPPQLSKHNGTTVSHTRLLVGNYVQIDNVIITGVQFDVPYLFYEDGLFDKVGVTISVAGNRKMTLKTHQWINDILMRKRADYTEWSSTNTLNSMFES